MKAEVAIERFILNELLFGSGRTTVHPDESLISSGILDSIAILRLMFFIEENFGIKIENGEVTPQNFQTINRLKAFLEAKQTAQQEIAE